MNLLYTRWYFLEHAQNFESWLDTILSSLLWNHCEAFTNCVPRQSEDLLVFCILTFGFCCLVPLFLCYRNQMIFQHVVLVLISCTCVFCIGSGPVSSRICWSPFQWSSETAASQPDLLALKVLISSPPSCLQPSSSNKSTNLTQTIVPLLEFFVILLSMRRQPDLRALKVFITSPPLLWLATTKLILSLCSCWSDD